jgi:hypothetical protein
VDVARKGYSVIKRISLLMVAALMAAMMMVATAAPAFAAPANPKPPPDTSGPGETGGADKPGTCTTTTQKGANVTTSETQGSCKNDKVDPDPTLSKKPPGTNK